MKTALAATPGVDVTTVNVDTSADGKVVTLTGSVKTAAAKTAAEKSATGVAGGATVKNQLTVR